MSSFIVVDHLDAIIEQMHTAVGEIVNETAAEITATYANTAAKDTGFMRSSAYTVTHGVSTYGANTSGGGPMLPEVEKPEDDQTAIAAVAADYAAMLEYGTRYMGAQPAFHPAVDKAERSFSHKLSELDKRVKG